MKIILVQREGDDKSATNQDMSRTIFLQIDDVKQEAVRRPEKPERMQDFKDHGQKTSKMTSCLPMGCGEVPENSMKDIPQVQRTPRQSSGYTNFLFSHCGGGRKDYVHEIDEPIRLSQSQPQTINDLGGILIRIADISSLARK